MTTRPQQNPGEIQNWPQLLINYRTDPAAIARLLPPGIAPGAEAMVRIKIYNIPVNGEPEYGIVLNIDAVYQDIPGEYTLGIGINQEGIIYLCQERWGQPKYLADTLFFRQGDEVVARVTHAGYTFLEFNGRVSDTLPCKGEYIERNEWWVKSVRSVDPASEDYDFPPHVVRVHATYNTLFREKVEGRLLLRDSPFDPIASQLPVLGDSASFCLWTPQFLSRKISLEGPLDPVAYLPFADTIGGSRWPGKSGAPIREAIY